ncbi:MAG: hypothetical protein KDA60_08965, partial [Planctomycetales bacterium]|nr:hypothetical protein [Planctomycetales bacterium]
ATGEVRWKLAAVPSARKLLGNGRLISVWPVRGGPAVADGVVYFAAGVWSFEGVFVYAIDAATGAPIWRNDQLGTVFGDHPHQTVAIGGLNPQGYLVVSDDEVIVPCSAAYPARLDRKTGDLIEFKLPTTPRFPGGWFASLDADTAKAVRRGQVSFDDAVNRQRHEDKLQVGHGETGISRQVQLGERTLTFDQPLDGVDGEIHTILYANEKLIAVNKAGTIYCLSEQEVASPPHHTYATDQPAPPPSTAAVRTAREYAQTAGATRGYAYVLGLTDGDIVRALATHTDYHVVAIDDDAERVRAVRSKLAHDGHYGTRCVVVHETRLPLGLPSYTAQLVTTENAEQLAKWFAGTPSTDTSALWQTLRPFGGVACLPNTESTRTLAQTLASEADTDTPTSLKEFLVSSGLDQEFVTVTRVGAIPGSQNYLGQWQPNDDQLVRFPVGVLWFGDAAKNFKRSPQPLFVDGVMISRSKDWLIRHDGPDHSLDYALHDPVFTDVYTGRILSEDEAANVADRFPPPPDRPLEPSQYRPPYQTNDWSPAKPAQGDRVNPLTGATEVRAFPKDYGCDGGVDYGTLYTMRSGTPAFYDKSLESGTTYISGPRSGCTNSIIPANGLLNVPYFYEGCTCSYPLPTSLALVPLPESHEQWAVWGESEPENIQRVGINFGAPGDRMTRDGTLWLNYPDTGGPSPQLSIDVEPHEPHEPTGDYVHSVWMEGGEGWPWVQASAVEGLAKFTVRKLLPGKYKVRMYVAEKLSAAASHRIQSITLQSGQIHDEIDAASLGGGARRGIVKEWSDVRVATDAFQLQLAGDHGTRISGLELIRTGDL